MSNATNYHSHCSFCDGKAPMEEFVEAAVKAGFVAYGVSSHAPLPFKTRWTLDKEAVPAYLEEIRYLKRKYSDRIELYAGMEIDYLNEEQNPASVYFQQLPLDFRIGSVHLVYTPDGEIIDTDTNPENFRHILDVYFSGDLKRLIAAYFEASMRMVDLGGFDFIGHVNKIGYNVARCDADLVGKGWYQSKLADLFALIAEKEIMVEINTKAYLQKGCFFPDVKDWFFIREHKIPVVVNSDAHLPELVNAGRPEVLKLLKEKGFSTVRQLLAGKWEDVEIVKI